MDNFQRKLTAILSADVAGYSRLMGEDEEGTVRTLNKYKKIIFRLIDENIGRLVDSPGDNVLAEFASVVDAVKCAVQVQKGLKKQNEELPSKRKMEFRIGINIGDVIQDGDRIYGDGVNVAARIESLAEPGGICISRTAYDQVKNKIHIECEYLGEYEVKNIREPVRVYKIQKEKTEMIIINESKTSISSGKPSIAVLPFLNMSNDPDQEYFSDGMSEEIISALTKLEGLKVISRTSAFYFKGKDTDLRTIGEKLKVDHILEGSVRKAGNKIRITAQLINVMDDAHLWADTYDRELEDVFAIQDEISHAVVENLKVKLKIKSEPFVKNYTKNTEAYELFLKGRYFQNKGVLVEYKKAIGCYEKAIKADSNFAPAYTYLAVVEFIQSLHYALPPKEMWSKVKLLTQKAVEIDETDSDTCASIGRIKSLYEYDWRGARIYFKRAIELNSSNSSAYLDYGMYLIGVGNINDAIEEFKCSLEIDPFRLDASYMLSVAYFFARKFEKAIAQSAITLELSPNDLMSLQLKAGCLAGTGEYDKGIDILQNLKDVPLSQKFLGWIYGKAGRQKEAQEILGTFLIKTKNGYFSPNMIAAVYAGLGDEDNAFEWLNKSVQERDPENWCIKVDPFFEDMHSDPRWAKLMEKMNLADYPNISG